MNKYKALMLDIDGTTIPNVRHALPTQRVIDAVQKAKSKIAVCLATGRPFRNALEIMEPLQITDPVILLGGAQIVAGPKRKFIYKRPLEEEDIAQILTILKPYNLALIMDQDEKSVKYIPGQTLKHIPFSILALNMSARVADEIADQLSRIPTITAHKIVSWHEGLFCLNISHTYATKQHAVFEVAKYMGISTHEIIGVGEGPNDFPLLMACGFKVAMGNAVPDLKAIADYIAPTAEEDGVVDVIEKFVLQ
jgi:HAD superfamily hydrolase (TIGR01484 family)